MRLPVLVAAVVFAPALAGCLTPGAEEALAPLDAAAFDTTGPWSRPLAEGPFGILPVEPVGLASFDGATLALGIWRPDTDARVPVLVDAGPHYGVADLPVDEPADRLGRFLVENFVPHGYAVVQANVRGTGGSSGCADLMGLAEQQDLDALVTYLGEAPWSSGAVALVGGGYDGAAAWEAARFGNPYLRTIVPIGGVTDLGGALFRNGSSESRAALLGTSYWLSGAEGGRSPLAYADGPHALGCVDGNPAQHAAWGAAAVANGGSRTVALDLEYWRVRDFRPGVAANYRGSVFAVHGLQDRDVAPSTLVPWFNDLGVERKLWLGQWGHAFPDRAAEHDHARFDFAETLLAWFDRHLKGLPVDTGPAVEVQDDAGRWRTEAAWPPRDAAFRTLHLSADGALVEDEPQAGVVRVFAPATAPLLPGAPALVGAPDAAWESEPFPADVRVSGLPQLHVTVVPSTPGGHLFARLYDVGEGEERLVGVAQMDLRYHRGGNEPTPVVPRAPYVAHMEFLPLDALVPAGHRLRLVVTQEVATPEEPDPMPTPLTGPVEVVLGPEVTSVLRLPLVARAPPPTPWDSG